MDINLITFSSGAGKHNNALAAHQDIICELQKYFHVNILSHNDIDKLQADDFAILFITQGGIESLVINQIDSLSRPIILLADDFENSLPASIEVASWIRRQGFHSEIVYGQNEEVIAKLQLLSDCFSAQLSLVGKRIGVFGIPSTLLISSSVDYLLAKHRWGIEFKDIQLDEVIDEFDRIRRSDVKEEVAQFVERASLCRECTPDDMIDAMRMYHALKNLCHKYDLQALTINCNRFIKKLPVTACVALSIFNDEGFVAGCECDLQSMFTMVAAKALTGQCSFMANLNHIDKEENKIILSHCTLATNLTEKFDLRSHYASGKSVAIQGYLPQEEITIVRCGGECLDEYYVSSGHIIQNTDYTPFYRTQIEIKLDTPVDYFLRNPLGNHHIIIPGNHTNKLNKFFQNNKCKKTE